MKKQMKRTVYEAPVTERFQVELEANFCGSAIDPETNNGTINDHEVNKDFGGDQFANDGWDKEE